MNRNKKLRKIQRTQASIVVQTIIPSIMMVFASFCSLFMPVSQAN